MGRTAQTRQPLLWAVVAFAAGIVSGVYAWRPSLWWLIAAMVCLLGAVRFRHRQRWRNGLGFALALAALGAIGAWSVQARSQVPGPASLAAYSDGAPVTVTAHVVHDGVLHGRGRFQRESVDVETEALERDGLKTPIATGVRLSIYSHGEWPSGDEQPEDTGETGALLPRVLTCGQRLRFPAKLREPHSFQNPGAWDIRGYLLGQGIAATASAPRDKIELLPGTAGPAFARWRSRARRSVLHHIHRLWGAPEASSSRLEADAAGLFDAMLIGERSFLARDTTAAWQRTGIYHILVVSGMNVAILAFVVFALLRRFRAGEATATVLTVLLAAGYAYLAESGAPILRSVLMLAIFLVTRLLYRERALLNALGAAALVLLVADPGALFEASFQLTFLSVLAIAGLAVPILERTSEPLRRSLRWLLSPAYDYSFVPRAAQLRLDLRMLVERMARLVPLAKPDAVKRVMAFVLTRGLGAGLAIYEVLVVSFTAQLAMTLPMAFYFHRATVVGLPANTLAVPLTGVLMSSSALALALSYVWLPLAKVPALVSGWALSGITWTVRLFGALRVADMRLPTPSLGAALVAAAALVLAMALMRRRALLAAGGMAALLASSLWLTLAPPRPQVAAGALEVTGIDVGQAESFLVVTPAGKTMLVDAGGPLGPFQSEFDFGEDVVAPYLWSRNFARLDAVVLTHAHSDHMGGMAGVIAAFHPREFWLGPNADTAELRRLLSTAESYGVRVQRRSAGERFEFGGATVEVFAPIAGWQVKTKPKNNDSLVLRVSFGQTSALLTGDVEKQVEQVLAEQQPRATLLKVAHNGSKTSTTPEFLAAVHPRLALISVGAHNSFGHPRREVLERLAQAQVSTYRTDTGGALTFILDGKSVTARPWALR